ncbi:hypothetical protein C3F00_036635, partial [Pseudomonas sp. MWU13-2860]
MTALYDGHGGFLPDFYSHAALLFLDCFHLSIATAATVGYGDMHLQTVYAHLVATFEIFIGMSGIALATGLVFARFSRPSAKILFARYAIVRPLNGRMTLMVRAANARQNVIAEAQAKLRLMPCAACRFMTGFSS